jgi:hypothetical protein
MRGEESSENLLERKERIGRVEDGKIKHWTQLSH